MGSTLIALFFAWAALAAPVDLNHASVLELEQLPGIGATKAQAIIDFRTQHGPFHALSDLDSVPGIGPATLASLQGLVTVDSSKPTPPAPPTQPATDTLVVDVNHAGLDDLEKLPGIGPAKAQAILVDRDANGPYRTCQDLARVPGFGAATIQSIADRCVAR